MQQMFKIIYEANSGFTWMRGRARGEHHCLFRHSSAREKSASVRRCFLPDRRSKAGARPPPA